MNREDILKKYNFIVPESKKVRVIVSTDAKNEADDQYAIVHHLLTPAFEVKGIIAAHFGEKFKKSQNSGPLGCSMQQSCEEAKKIVDLMNIDDIPVIKGAVYPLDMYEDDFSSEGADFIINEAMKDDDRPLYIALQGCLTDLALAYKKNPEIENRLTAIWIGGGNYPNGGNEFNLYQDVKAAQIVFESSIPLWQIPVNTYRQVEVSFAELQLKVSNCGEIGKYLFQQLIEYNEYMGKTYPNWRWPHGETWCIGDQPTITVLLQSRERCTYHLQYAPIINDDMTYTLRTVGREIRVYDFVDARMTIEDLFAKLFICYGSHK